MVNVNGNFYKGWSFISDLIILNLLWLGVTLLGCGVTFGAATAACYTLGNKIANKKNYSIFKDFFKSFKDNFIKATVAWFIIAALGVLCVYNYGLVENMNSWIIKGIFYFSAFQLIITTLYIFIVIASFEGSVGTYFLSSFVIANKHLWTTILMLSSLAGTVFLCFYVSSFLNIIVWGFFFASTSYWANKILEGYRKSTQERIELEQQMQK